MVGSYFETPTGTSIAYVNTCLYLPTFMVGSYFETYSFFWYPYEEFFVKFTYD